VMAKGVFLYNISKNATDITKNGCIKIMI